MLFVVCVFFSSSWEEDETQRNKNRVPTLPISLSSLSLLFSPLDRVKCCRDGYRLRISLTTASIPALASAAAALVSPVCTWVCFVYMCVDFN